MGWKKEIGSNEKAVLVGVITPDQSEDQVNEFLDELEFLALTAGATTVKKFIQKVSHPNPKTLVGSGKVQEILDFVTENDIEVVLFDDELSASQLRNLEKIFERKILDRSNLILDIFAKRARTAHARTQVELAQYEYLLPRLTRMWTHLSRQKGGIGMRGPGETEIETDRRIIRDKISRLRQRLKEIDKQKFNQRNNREHLVRVALVGYTNVGKSTLMNVLSKSEVFAENKLFATLDTTVRKVVIDNLPFLLSDTVGFIRKLPHQLVESFKSTLDEVRESDLLLHVVDASHPTFEDHVRIVQETLSEIGCAETPTIMVYNKIDRLKVEQDGAELRGGALLSYLEHSWMNNQGYPALFISALNKLNMQTFRQEVYNHIKSIHEVRYPYNKFLY